MRKNAAAFIFIFSLFTIFVLCFAPGDQDLDAYDYRGPEPPEKITVDPNEKVTFLFNGGFTTFTTGVTPDAGSTWLRVTKADFMGEQIIEGSTEVPGEYGFTYKKHAKGSVSKVKIIVRDYLTLSDRTATVSSEDRQEMSLSTSIPATFALKSPPHWISMNGDKLIINAPDVDRETHYIAEIEVKAKEGNQKINEVISIKIIPPFKITSTSSEGGTIDPIGETKTNKYSSYKYTFRPNEGYRISKVQIDGAEDASAKSSGTYTFSDVRSSRSISVFFELIPYTISASYGGNGSVLCESGNIVPYGSDKNVIIRPNEGHIVSKAVVDGRELSESELTVLSSGEYTFKNVRRDHSIFVSFERASYTINITQSENGHVSYGTDSNVLHGDRKEVTFHPDEGFRTSRVLIDGTENPYARAEGGYAFEDVRKDHSVSVSFEPVFFTINASAGENGRISCVSGSEVRYGGQKQVVFYPDEGYGVSKALVDGVEVSMINGGYIFDDVRADHDVRVSFERLSYTINVSSEQNGHLSFDPENVLHGGQKRITIHPDEGYKISNVLVDGIDTPVTNGEYIFDDVRGNHSISIAFERIKYTISILNGANGEIFCGSSNEVFHGSDKRLEFRPDKGYKVTDVTITENGKERYLGPVAEYTFPDVKGNCSVKASFGRMDYKISFIGEAGTIKKTDGSDANDIEYVLYSDSMDVLIGSIYGFSVKDVIVNGESKGNIGSYAFTNVECDNSLEVVLEPVDHAVVVSGKQGGKISQDGVVLVKHGSSLRLTLTPDEGYKVSKIYINGQEYQGEIEEYMFIDVREDQVFSVSFEMIPENMTAAMCAICVACAFAFILLIYEIKLYRLITAKKGCTDEKIIRTQP